MRICTDPGNAPLRGESLGKTYLFTLFLFLSFDRFIFRTLFERVEYCVCRYAEGIHFEWG